MAELEPQAARPNAAPPAPADPPEAPRPIVAPPTPIRKPSQPEAPRLFDGFPDLRPTGTYGGPAKEAKPSPRRWTQHAPPVPQIPANVAVREILQFLAADRNTANWSAEATQDLFAAYKAGHIGLWERGK